MNCYIITYNNHCFIVDPGFEKFKVQEYIKKNNLIVEGILLTHPHFDHIGAIDSFDVPVYLHKDGLELFQYSIDRIKDANQFSTLHELEEVKVVFVNDNDEIPFLDKSIKVIHTPGHTRCSVCYLFENSLYSGDTLFNNTVGRTDLYTSNPEDMKQTIIMLLETLDEDVKVKPGHGFSTTIRKEKEGNPFYLNIK